MSNPNNVPSAKPSGAAVPPKLFAVSWQVEEGVQSR